MTTAQQDANSADRRDLSTAEQAQEAEQWVRDEAVKNGRPPSGAAVSRKFGRSPRWGQDRVNAVFPEADGRSKATASARPVGTAGAPIGTAGADAATGASARGSTSARIGTAETATLTVGTPKSAPASARPSAQPSSPPSPIGMPIGTASARADSPADAASARPSASAPSTWRSACRQILPILPLLLIGSGAFVSIWGGWVGLGKLTGFGDIELIPGVPASAFNTAITLPLGMEAYAAYALRVWLAPPVNLSPGARSFARWSAMGALGLGAAGQIAYHLMVAAGIASAPWWITAFVACLPVAVLGFGAALAHLIRHPERGHS